MQEGKVAPELEGSQYPSGEISYSYSYTTGIKLGWRVGLKSSGEENEKVEANTKVKEIKFSCR